MISASQSLPSNIEWTSKAERSWFALQIWLETKEKGFLTSTKVAVEVIFSDGSLPFRSTLSVGQCGLGLRLDLFLLAQSYFCAALQVRPRQICFLPSAGLRAPTSDCFAARRAAKTAVRYSSLAKMKEKKMNNVAGRLLSLPALMLLSTLSLRCLVCFAAQRTSGRVAGPSLRSQALTCLF